MSKIHAALVQLPDGKVEVNLKSGMLVETQVIYNRTTEKYRSVLVLDGEAVAGSEYFDTEEEAIAHGDKSMAEMRASVEETGGKVKDVAPRTPAQAQTRH